jgi:GNAT superfamily N-acetyltransferase
MLRHDGTEAAGEAAGAGTAPPAVSIRPVASIEEVRGLDHYLADASPEKHRRRLEQQQQGRVTYLVAWEGARPVGHVLVRWGGPVAEPLATAYPDCPQVEDFFVDAAYRGRRVGLRLLGVAEEQARLRGYRRIGLSVGLTPSFDRARSLYARFGFRNAGFAPYYEGWWVHDEQGRRRWWEEACEYLIKDLEQVHNSAS